MNQVAVENGEIVVGLPFVYYPPPGSAAYDWTKTQWYGPDRQIAKTATTGVELVSNRPVITVTADERGAWQLILRDAANNVIHTANFCAVSALSTLRPLGLERKSPALVTLWPTNAYNSSSPGATDITNGAGAVIRCYASQFKWVVPQDGYIFGVSIYNRTTAISSMTGLRLATVDPSTTLVRGISENMASYTPVSGAWATGAYNDYRFRKPVLAKAGDWIVLEADDTGGGGLGVYLRRVQCKTDSAVIQEIKILNAALSLSAANTFIQWSTGIHYLVDFKLLMHPAPIAIAGHSFWAGHPSTHTWAEDSTVAHNRLYDPAIMLQDRLGVPVVNVADGGTNITDWIGSAGLFETILAPLTPSVMIYDTVYNDYLIDSTTYIRHLDRLLTHCDQAGVELILLQAPGSYYANTQPDNARALGIERLNSVAALWCNQNGVGYIPLTYRIGYHSGGTEEAAARRQQKHWNTDFVSFGLPDYDVNSETRVHLSGDGLEAVAMAIASWFRRRHREPQIYREQFPVEELMPSQRFVPRNTSGKTGF